MKRAKFLFLTILIVSLLASCSDSVQNANNGEKKGGQELDKLSAEAAIQKDSTLTEIPLLVGAEPRCCLGINVQKAEMQTNPDLLILQLEVRTLLGFQEGITDTNLYLGYKDMIPVFNLLTEQGVYQGYLHEPQILKEGEPKSIKVIFADVKGKPLGLSVRRVFEESQVQDGSYRDADNQGTFAYLEDVNEEMMLRIGRGLFDKVTSIELAKTEEEAWEILTPLFDQDSPPEIYNVLFDEITYGDYSSYEIKYLDESVEFKDKGAFIQYEASVEIHLYGQNGALARTKGFGVSSLISISKATGNYMFSGLDYDYLTGTDSYWDVGD
ncbi:hypothetical protein [Neobacillus sp. YIM B06451]|uniref:hypothetical protein n=1 Tax=Neobacillus sp. YIM B06451 TaxID=3070994 RepID=UPI0029315F1A|nr:hypothetical protein [Neobacillus sp. YIM B06451]